MRLLAPIETTSLMILKGPGTTRLFETNVEKMASPDTFYPKLRFTVENPNDLKPMTIDVEMDGNWEPVHFHFELNGSVYDSCVRVKYWLRKDKTGYQGTISDR